MPLVKTVKTKALSPLVQQLVADNKDYLDWLKKDEEYKRIVNDHRKQRNADWGENLEVEVKKKVLAELQKKYPKIDGVGLWIRVKHDANGSPFFLKIYGIEIEGFNFHLYNTSTGKFLYNSSYHSGGHRINITPSAKAYADSLVPGLVVEELTQIIKDLGFRGNVSR